MKRREFLNASRAGAAAFLAGLAGCVRQSPKSLPQSQRPLHTQLFTDEHHKEGFTLSELKQLKKQYVYDLFDDFLPFMEKHVIDHEYGGFMCTADRNGTNISTDKNTWFEGRGIWVYSFLYNKVDSNLKYLEAAKKSVEFMLKHKPSDDNLWPSSFTREGKPIGEPDKRTYGDLFVAHGLAEYSNVSKESQYWEMAKEIMMKCIRIYDRPDFFPEAARKDYRLEEAPLTPGARLLGLWFVLLNLASQMLEVKADAEILAVTRRSLDAIMNYHYNPEFDLLNEILNHDFSRPQNDLAQFVYTGHAIEALWMVLYEAARRRDKNLFDLAAKRFKRHLEVAWDEVYGGIFRSLDNVEKNTWKLDKALWAQEEALIGTLSVVEHTGQKWAKDWFVKVYNYVQEKFPLKKHGYALWDSYTDRKVTFVEHSNRVENFHHPRHLMLNLLSINRMIERKGEISNLFG
jgi:N-acylglucosamine 2-epimerase